MRKYDIKYQAFRMQYLDKLSNMDPDEIVSEIGVETDDLIQMLSAFIELHIEKEYDNGDEEGEDEDEVGY